MEKIKEMIKGNIRQYAMFFALLLVTLLFGITTKGVLLVPQNVSNLIQQNSYILILAMGMLLCILGGKFDLSVGSVAAFVGAISAVFAIKMQMSPLLSIVLGLLLGAAIGAFQGFWIAYMNVPAFIVTLAGMLMFRGLTLVVLAGRTLAPFPVSYQIISSGFLPDVFHIPGVHFTSIIIGLILCPIILVSMLSKRAKRKKHGLRLTSIPVFIIQVVLALSLLMFITYWFALYKGLPTVLLLLLGLFILYTFITQKTVNGRHLYALGGNEKAAMLSGVKTKKIIFLAYTNMGLLSALAGIVFAGRLNAATPRAGTGFELDAIAACFIGGASSSGGIGTVAGAMVGALLMGVLNNGMSILGVNVDWQQTIKGAVLLIAVIFDVYSKSKSRST